MSSDRPPKSSDRTGHTSASDGKEAPAPSAAIQKWVDPAMFSAMKLSAAEGPQVSLTQAPSDPLGVIAQLAMAYEGRFVASLAEITDEERRRYLADMQLTKLAMPLEGVSLVFSISGVTRGFTHQMVRQRTAAYSQESTRFAVIEDSFTDRVALPPSLRGTTGTEPLGAERSTVEWQRNVWDQALRSVEEAYQHLVNSGMPAEDARGLLPTNITTRINYVTNLRGLLDHAGNRLCTQAQFEWRLVFAQIAKALRQYGIGKKYKTNIGMANDIRVLPLGPDGKPDGGAVWGLGNGTVYQDKSSVWQFEAIAELLKPVCYQIGRCPMKASFDRACSIRDRVDANDQVGRSSSDWNKAWVHPKFLEGDESYQFASGEVIRIEPIHPAEWLADPGAAR